MGQEDHKAAGAAHGQRCEFCSRERPVALSKRKVYAMRGQHRQGILQTRTTWESLLGETDKGVRVITEKKWTTSMS